MKKIFLTTLILTFFCDSLLSQSLPSPSSGPAGIFDRTDSRLMNAMTDLTNRRARKAATPAGVKGSYYFNENFQLSTVIYFGEELKDKTYLRYNAANDEIEMGESSKQKDSENILLKSAKVNAIINNEKYKLLPHRLKESNYPVIGYLVVLVDNEKYSLFLKRKKVFMKAVEARTSLDRSFPARFVDDVTYYFSLNKDTPLPLRISKSNIRKISKESGSKVKTFIKDNNIKIKSSEGLIEVFNYLNSQ